MNIGIVVLSSMLAASPPSPTETKCGPYCLYIALSSLDLYSQPFAAFEKETTPPGKEGYTMHDMEANARRHGAHTLAVEADLTVLSRLTVRRVCIALLNHHYVVVKAIDAKNDKVSVIDPPYEFDRSFHEFQRGFTGKSLILSREPLSLPDRPSMNTPSILAIAVLVAIAGLCLALTARRWKAFAALLVVVLFSLGCDVVDRERPDPGGPTLQITPESQNAGVVFLGDDRRTAEFETVLHNRSNKPINIIEIEKSCACASALLQSNVIGPGRRMVLKTTFNLGETPGPSRMALTLTTSETEHPKRRLAFAWTLATPLSTSPARCDLGRLEPGQSTSTRLELRSRGVNLCRNCRVEVGGDSPLLKVRHEATIDPRLPREHDGGTEGSMIERGLGTIFVEEEPSNEPGEFVHHVEVVLNCKGEQRSRLVVPVNGQVRPKLELGPSRLWLGSIRRGETVVRTIRLSSHTGVRARVTSASATSGPFVCRVTTREEPSDEQAVTLAVDAPRQSGLHRGVIEFVVSAEGESTLAMPISALVRDGE